MPGCRTHSCTQHTQPQALPTYVGSLAFVSGFLIRFDDMPACWRWYSRANPLAYAFTARELPGISLAHNLLAPATA